MPPLKKGSIMFCTCPFAWKLLNLVQWMPIGSRWLLFFCRSHGQSKGQTAGFQNNVVRSTFLDPFAGKFLNLVQWMPLESGCLGHMFEGQCQTPKCCLLNSLWVELWIKVKLSTANNTTAASQNNRCLFCH